jgi:Arm DNA-binding domain
MSELNEAGIRAAKPKEKPYKLRDGRGLHLLITPNGGRLWRFRYRHAGRESMVSLGAYPDVPLKDARERREEARRALASGVDPAAKRKTGRASLENTFEAIALEWLGKQQFATATREKAEWTFRELLFPHIGSRPIATITPPELLGVLRRIEVRGRP